MFAFFLDWCLFFYLTPKSICLWDRETVDFLNIRITIEFGMSGQPSFDNMTCMVDLTWHKTSFLILFLTLDLLLNCSSLNYYFIQGPVGPKGDAGDPGLPGYGVKVVSVLSHFQALILTYTLMFYWLLLLLCAQGEKGEPGLIIGPDGNPLYLGGLTGQKASLLWLHHFTAIRFLYF